MMSELFSFAIKTDKNINIGKEESVSKNIFTYVFEIYSLIRKGKIEYEEELEKILSNINDNEYSFMVWILNHYLVYNKFTRNNIELITLVSSFLSNKEYVYYYVKFMIQNNIKFPKYMAWYNIKYSSENKKFTEFLKEKYDISDEEISDILEYVNKENISIRDICISLNSFVK